MLASGPTTRLLLPPLRFYTTNKSIFKLVPLSNQRKPFKFDHENGGSTSIPLRDGVTEIIRPIASVMELPLVYARLCKAKLSGLVVCTTLAGYMIAPHANASIWSMATSPGLWSTLAGTALCAGAANAWNQWAESKHDARMLRTRCRPLPTKQISSAHAFGWASVCAAAGLGTLYVGAGPVAMGLAASTIGLYTLVYTPLKRYTVLNTWVGAVVGALPPLIGYAGAISATGMLGVSALLPDAALLGGVLYCWQFPHFNALAYNLRQDYNRAGYCMASIYRPTLNRTSALLHAAALIPVTVAFSPLGTGLASWAILLDGGALAAWLTVLAAQFYQRPGKGTARRLFLASLLYLPLFLGCLVLHRQTKTTCL